MNKDITKIVKELYKKYSTDFTEKEIVDILAFDDTVMDIPISVGKRLCIEYVNFKGIKKNGDMIDFNMDFSNGINIIIADNLKGKSSLFKIIKTAFVGDDNYIKPDVRKWIDEITLGFMINEKRYCILMNMKKRVNSILYNCSYEEVINNSEISDRIIFKANSNIEHANGMQAFFFNQFSYFSMKWTQKISSKTSHDLVEAGTSWKTYFKTIYLESRDSTSFYGGQEQKTFQMLLSLEFTKYINKLTVKKEMLQSDLAMQESYVQHNRLNIDSAELKGELDSVNERLSTIRDNEKIKKLDKLKEQRDKVKTEISDNNRILAENYKNKKEYFLKLEGLERKKSENESEYKRIGREILKSKRLLNDIQEYLEVGQFFSSLEITSCPSCNHHINHKLKGEAHICPLCHEKTSNSGDEEKYKYIEKTTELSNLIEKLEQEQTLIKSRQEEVVCELIEVEKAIQDYSLLISNSEEKYSEDTFQNLNMLIKNLEDETNDIQKIEKDLIAAQAVLSYKLEQIKEGGSENLEIEELGKRISLLEDAIYELDNLRFSRSENILNELKKSMLSVIHDFGLESISEIVIDNKYNITYIQNDTNVKFSDIAEGEQLRVKLAFYLSLIQLDIDKNYGRHTRLLIIDSPNKEEGDTAYLEGFKETLNVIQEKYQDYLQIIIGTATRDLKGIVENEKVYLEGEYLF